MASTDNSCLWLYAFQKNICLCGKGDNSNLNIDTMNWITDEYASKTPQPNAKRFQKRRFLKIGQSETRIACGGHVC
jgi:hypothetical protein